MVGGDPREEIRRRREYHFIRRFFFFFFFFFVCILFARGLVIEAELIHLAFFLCLFRVPGLLSLSVHLQSFRYRLRRRRCCWIKTALRRTKTRQRVTRVPSRARTACVGGLPSSSSSTSAPTFWMMMDDDSTNFFCINTISCQKKIKSKKKKKKEVDATRVRPKAVRRTPNPRPRRSSRLALAFALSPPPPTGGRRPKRRSFLP